jgi:uncharacterized membrane-anchored protein
MSMIYEIIQTIAYGLVFGIVLIVIDLYVSKKRNEKSRDFTKTMKKYEREY